MGRARLKLTVDPALKAELKKRFKAANEVRQRQRLQAILLATTGQHGYRDIGQIVGCSPSTFSLWLNKFLSGGIAELLRRETPPGSPSPLGAAVLQAELCKQSRHESSRTADIAPNSAADSPESGSSRDTTCPEQFTEGRKLPLAAKALIEIIHHNPKAYGINRTNWTLESLAYAFEKQFGQKPARSTVGRLLKQAGLRWKKSRQVLTSTDPNYKEKVELLLKTLKSLKADEDLFFIDEMGPLAVRRHGGRCYTPKGEAPTYLALTAASKTRALYRKQAIDLIKQYGNLDSIFKNLAKVASERIRQKLQGNEVAMRDRFVRSTVAAVQHPCYENFKNSSLTNLNNESNRQFLREYGFHSLVRLLEDSPDSPF